MLIFDPQIDGLHWARLHNGMLSKGLWQNTNNPECMELLKAASGITCVLPNGAVFFRKPAYLLSAEILPLLERCVPYAPIANQLALDAAQRALALRAEMPIVLLCETAFFSSMAPAASTYALPLSYRHEGIKRFGGDGLCLDWAARFVPQKKRARVLSVHIGAHPAVAAVLNGQAVETSMGYSIYEGLPSLHSCGNIDPSITLMLHDSGISISDTLDLLIFQSGLSALENQLPDVQDYLYHQMLETLGAAAAALGGADAIVFACDQLAEALPLIQRLCQALVFMGLVCRPEPLSQDGQLVFSTDDSPLWAGALPFHRWDVLHEYASNLLTNHFSA